MGLEAINDADATSNSGQRNPYLKPGNYVVEIVNIRFFTTRYKGDAALVTLRPVTSSNPEVELGVMHTWYCGFNNDLGPINFKRLTPGSRPTWRRRRVGRRSRFRGKWWGCRATTRRRRRARSSRSIRGDRSRTRSSPSFRRSLPASPCTPSTLKPS
jgi:hypothetical protein